MPTYGRLPYLNRAVASFLGQDYDDKELVIVNDDRNIQIVCNIPGVTCINLNKKILVAQKRNLATQLGYHDLYMPFDDDDIFLPQRISNHVKIHKDNPDLGLYRNISCYMIYGDSFHIDGSADNACSFTRQAWFKAGGYAHDRNIMEDKEFNQKVENKIEESNPNIDFVYNYGGVNYHLSSGSDSNVKGIAHNQLIDMGLLNGKFYIEPDFGEYNKFITLDKLFKERNPKGTNNPVKVIHTGVAKLDIA